MQAPGGERPGIMPPAEGPGRSLAELSPAERRRLALDFAQEMANREGCAVDVAIHAPGKGGDHQNHHAHILLTTRRLTPEGFSEKTRELDDRKTKEVDGWRERFASLQNERLRENGLEARVDHRSHAERGIETAPTLHLGPGATGYERRTGELFIEHLPGAEDLRALPAALSVDYLRVAVSRQSSLSQHMDEIDRQLQRMREAGEIDRWLEQSEVTYRDMIDLPADAR